MKRTKKLIKPKFQIKIVASFFAISCVAVLLQTIVINRAFSHLAAGMPIEGDMLLGDLPVILRTSLLITFAVLAPLTIAMGVVSTFRIAGPVYRFEQFFAQLARGEDPTPLKLRKRDEMHGLCDLINAGLARVRADSARHADAPADRNVNAPAEVPSILSSPLEVEHDTPA